MPAHGGTNGVVQSTTAGPTSNSATVKYPPDPPGTTEVYLDLTLTQLGQFNSSLGKVDVTCDPNGVVTSVTAHR